VIGRAALRRFPWLVAIAALVLIAIGVAYIRSASAEKGHAFAQTLWLGVAAAGFAAAAFIPYSRFERAAYVLYGAALLLLAGLPFAGQLVNGARSWYQLGPAKLQPSELMKIALILAIARWLMYRADRKTLRGFLSPLILVLPPLVLILKQPDFGTTMVFIPVIVAMLFAGGARLRYFGAAAGLALVAAPLVWRVLKPYQRERVLVFLDPARDPMGAGFQSMQSLTAIGSGGVTGKGYGEGTQTQLHYLPDSHTDFIFAVVAEEGGLLQAGLVLALFLAVVLGCLEVAHRTREPFGRLVAVGVAALFAGQAAVNCAMAMGLAPVTGITLPFLSYGGSSLLTSFIALGLVANVAVRQEPVLAEDFR
jgi:rod shape determining protein RodA